MRIRLVLVHGSRSSGVQWAAHRSWLEPEFEVITPDLPAHGRRAGERFTMAAAVRAVAEAVEDVKGGAGDSDTDGGERAAGSRPPVVLVGHSLGGYVAMEYAAAAYAVPRHPAAQHGGSHPTPLADAVPQRPAAQDSGAPHSPLAGLMTIGAAAVPRGPGAAAYRMLGWATDRANRDQVTRLNDRLLSRMAPAEVFEPIRDEGYWFDGVRDSWDAVMASGRPELLRNVGCPVLVVRGQWDQLGIDGRAFAAAAPDARLRTVRGASHLFPLTRPWQSSALIAAFAREVGRAGESGGSVSHVSH